MRMEGQGKDVHSAAVTVTVPACRLPSARASSRSVVPPSRTRKAMLCPASICPFVAPGCPVGGLLFGLGWERGQLGTSVNMDICCACLC